MRQPPTPRVPRIVPDCPATLPPVVGAALAEGPGGVVFHFRASGGGVLHVPISSDALREIAALATDALNPAARRAPPH